MLSIIEGRSTGTRGLRTAKSQISSSTITHAGEIETAKLTRAEHDDISSFDFEALAEAMLLHGKIFLKYFPASQWTRGVRQLTKLRIRTLTVRL